MVKISISLLQERNDVAYTNLLKKGLDFIPESLFKRLTADTSEPETKMTWQEALVGSFHGEDINKGGKSVFDEITEILVDCVDFVFGQPREDIESIDGVSNEEIKTLLKSLLDEVVEGYVIAEED